MAVLRLAFYILLVVMTLVSCVVFASADLRKLFGFVIYRNIAVYRPPIFVFVGDSIPADCHSSFKFSIHPLDTANIAVGGSRIRDVANGQLYWADKLGFRYLIILVGVNDVVEDRSSVSQVLADFQILLDRAGRMKSGGKIVLSLLPYVSDSAHSDAITIINSQLSREAALRGIQIVDLNELMTSGGTRKPEMTTDGVHFSRLACTSWAATLARDLSL